MESCLLREEQTLASGPSNVSPAPHPLYVLHYAIKSAITILDVGLQMSQIAITPDSNTPHLPFQLPSLIV
jgi:hypothetical protein